MYPSNTLTIIKESFELWYNKRYSGSPVSIVINYSDTQKLAIKAIHTATIEVKAFCSKNNLTYSRPIMFLQENYNHGITSEQEAKDRMTERLLIKLYNFDRKN